MPINCSIMNTYRRNCGPPMPIACEVWPQTRSVNSFSIGSGKVYWIESEMCDISWIFVDFKDTKENSQLEYFPNPVVAVAVCVLLRWISVKFVAKGFRMHLLLIELHVRSKVISKHLLPAINNKMYLIPMIKTWFHDWKPKAAKCFWSLFIIEIYRYQVKFCLFI